MGKTQKTLDINLELPSTGETAFVQVKSSTSSPELAEYVEALEDSDYAKMFFVFHSGEATLKAEDDRVIIIGPDKLKLPDMVIDAGLVSWLIQKAS